MLCEDEEMDGIDLNIKGEGGANIVFENTLKNSLKYKSVIRIRKRDLIPRDKTKSQDFHDRLDAIIWSDILHHIGTLDSIESDMFYVQKIMAPLLGSQYLPSPQVVCIIIVIKKWFVSTSHSITLHLHDRLLILYHHFHYR